MAARLTFEYDQTGDILYISRVPPYAEQESTELDDYVVARYNPKTGDLESLEVLFFSRRLREEKVLEIPVDAFRMAV